MDSKRFSPEQIHDELSGRIFRARIKKSRVNYCDLDLLAPEDGSVLAQARLYQSESAYHKDTRLLADIPHYKAGEFLEAVFVNHSRQEQGQVLWFVHERWGVDNPWSHLTLREDDIVTGEVLRRIPDRDDPAGYLVQLHVGTPLQSCAPSYRKEYEERSQQDIEVFLPAEELPWADGSLTDLPSPTTRKGGRLRLELGDPIQALVRKIHQPPDHPVVSLTALINHRDAQAAAGFERQEAMALWHFRRLLGSGTAGATSEAETAFPADFTPYQGRRILLVDDDVDAQKAQAELLELMGANVRCIRVKPGELGLAIHEVSTALREEVFDLVLVDNNLPGRGLGQSLVEKVRAQLLSPPTTRFVLVTANAVNGLDERASAALQAKGLDGQVQRPLSHPTLQKLLAGETIWEACKPLAAAPTASPASSTGSPGLHVLLQTLSNQKGILFVMLFKALRHIEARDILALGAAPFGHSEYGEVFARSDLHLLVEGRIEHLDITPGEGANEPLHGMANARAHWRVLESGGSRWILGIGYGPEMDIRGQLAIWHAAVSAALEVQSWRQWAEHVSGFVQLGLAHQGLSHEVFNMQDEFGNLLSNLRTTLGKLPEGTRLEGKARKGLETRIDAIEKANGDLLEFAKHQLRGQSLRHRQVFLPEAVKAIKRIVDTECKEAEVAFHVAPPPTLALPLPHAALVLPVVNLLVNAAKHHYRQENRRVELSFDLEDTGGQQTLLVHVRDNGPGLKQSVLERLWQPGFSSASEADKQHGIGLWLSQQLVEEAGGSVSLIENWRGLGACFRLSYPIHLG